MISLLHNENILKERSILPVSSIACSWRNFVNKTFIFVRSPVRATQFSSSTYPFMTRVFMKRLLNCLAQLCFLWTTSTFLARLQLFWHDFTFLARLQRFLARLQLFWHDFNFFGTTSPFRHWHDFNFFGTTSTFLTRLQLFWHDFNFWHGPHFLARLQVNGKVPSKVVCFEETAQKARVHCPHGSVESKWRDMVRWTARWMPWIRWKR